MLTSFLTRYILIPIAGAQSGDGSSAQTPLNVKLFDPLNGTTIPDLISRIFTALVWVAAFIAPIFIIYGAFQILTSAGNSEKLSKGKNTILYTVLGFLVVLAAKGIVDIVKTALTIK